MSEINSSSRGDVLVKEKNKGTKKVPRVQSTSKGEFRNFSRDYKENANMNQRRIGKSNTDY